MHTSTNPSGPRLVPALRYRDVAGAVEWLCTAFGFKTHDIVTAVDGAILQARLTFGNDMIMLLPVRNADLGVVKQPDEIGAEMQSCYFVVDDADGHYRKAKAAGADILDVMEYDYGGRGYSCRDPEGHIWNFGTYDPRQAQHATDPWIGRARHRTAGAVRLGQRIAAALNSVGDKVNPPVIVAAIVAAVIAAATVGWMLVALPQPAASGKDQRLTSRAMAPPPTTEEAADRAGRPAVEASERRTLAFKAMPPLRSEEERADPKAVESSKGNLVAGAIAAHQASAEGSDRASPKAPEPARANPSAAAAITARPATVGGSERAGPSTAEPGQVNPIVVGAIPAPQATAEGSEAARRRAAALAQERTAKDTAERAAVEAFRQLRPAPETPGERPAMEAPKEAPKQLATAPQQAREQLARERVAKETQRAKVTAAQPAKVPAAQEQSADTWECLPTPPTGQVVCIPQVKKPTPSEGMALAAPATQRWAPRTQERKEDGQLWQCLPNPATGQVACRPGVSVK